MLPISNWGLIFAGVWREEKLFGIICGERKLEWNPMAERRMGEPVRFSLEENASTGFKWEVESSTNECTVVLKHRGGDKGTTCGASGLLDVTVTSLVSTPVRVEFRYRRPWEKDIEPWKTLRLVVNTVGGEQQGNPR